MTISPHSVILYVLVGIMICALLYSTYKHTKLVASVRSINNFLHGDVFSDQFRDVVDSYMARTDAVANIADRVMPIVYSTIAPTMLLLGDDDKDAVDV